MRKKIIILSAIIFAIGVIFSLHAIASPSPNKEEEYAPFYTGSTEEEFLHFKMGVKKKINLNDDSPNKKAVKKFFQFMMDDSRNNPIFPELIGLREELIRADFIDLDDDGIYEIIGYPNISFYRWNYGKEVLILKKDKYGEYKKMQELSIAPWSDIDIMNHKTNGYYDIRYEIVASRMPARTVVSQYKNNEYYEKFFSHFVYSKDKSYNHKAYNFKVKKEDYTQDKEGILKRIDFKQKPNSLASDILYEFHTDRYGRFDDVVQKSDVKGYFVDINDDGVLDIIGEVNRYRKYDKEKKKYKTTEIIVRRSNGWETLLLLVLYEADYIDVLNSKTNGYHDFMHVYKNDKSKHVYEDSAYIEK